MNDLQIKQVLENICSGDIEKAESTFSFQDDFADEKIQEAVDILYKFFVYRFQTNPLVSIDEIVDLAESFGSVVPGEKQKAMDIIKQKLNWQR